jgi:hypothetical protein
MIKQKVLGRTNSLLSSDSTRVAYKKQKNKFRGEGDRQQGGLISLLTKMRGQIGIHNHHN